MLAVQDQFPPGLLRAAYEGLSHAYEILGRTQDAEAARSRSGRLITDYGVTADDGFRFVPQQLAELAPGVHVAQGYDFSDLAFVLTAEGIVTIDAGPGAAVTAPLIALSSPGGPARYGWCQNMEG